MLATGDGERGERELISNRYTVATRMISAFKMGSDLSHFNVLLIALVFF